MRTPHPYKILILFFLLTPLTVMAAKFIPDDDASDLNTCYVTTVKDNAKFMSSFRAKVEKGFNNTSESFCRDKIILKNNINLDTPIVIDNPNDNDGLFIEAEDIAKGVTINAKAIGKECAITFKSRKPTLRGIHLVGGGICVDNADEANFQNISVREAKTNGLHLLNGSAQLTLKNASFFKNTGDGIKIEGSANDYLLENITITNNEGAGLSISGSANNHQLKNLTSSNNQGDGINIKGSCYKYSMTDIEVSSNSGQGIVIEGNADEYTITNATVTNNTGGDGLKISSSSNLHKISSSSFLNNNGHGINLLSTNNTITNNQFNENAQDGIYIKPKGINRISNNSFYHNKGIAVNSPNTAFEPTIQTLSVVQGTQNTKFRAEILVPAGVSIIQLYRTDLLDSATNSTNATTFIQSASEGQIVNNRVSMTFPAQPEIGLFALGITANGITSSMSEIVFTDPDTTTGSSNPGNNSGTPFNPNELCDETDNATDNDSCVINGANNLIHLCLEPIEPGTTITMNHCQYGVGPSDNRTDSDCDGILDIFEDRNHNCKRDLDAGDGYGPETNLANSDTDDDEIFDGLEDRNHDGIYQQKTETNPHLEDTDGDDILDGDEDHNRNGLKDQKESDPIRGDSDNDGILDQIEDLNRNGLWDAGETKAYHADTDLDGLFDGKEDMNHNGSLDFGESNPRLQDTDKDGISDSEDDCPQDNDLRCRLQCVPFGKAVSAISVAKKVYVDPSLLALLAGEESGDLQPNPSIDRDNDGISDRDEDLNGNCIQDGFETNPRLFDSDDDTISDRIDPCPLNVEKNCSFCVPGALIAPLYDSDNDNYPNYLEDVNGNCVQDNNESNINNPDSDSDGFLDGTEIKFGYNPILTDSDSDGMLDWEEDINRDGIKQALETSPIKADTDDDKWTDLFDLCPNDPDPKCERECQVGGLDSKLKDSDHDGLPNHLEDIDEDCFRDANETDAFNKDTDNDFIFDGFEDINGNGLADKGETDPRKPDTDGDGILDGIEDLNHNGINDFGELNPRFADTDLDGIADFREDTNRNGKYDEGETASHLIDSDFDSLADGEEDKNRNGLMDLGETDPRNADSDGDGAPDSVDEHPIRSLSSDRRNLTGEPSNCSLHSQATVSPRSGYLLLLFMIMMSSLAVIARRLKGDMAIHSANP